jgi:hypothetical protein
LWLYNHPISNTILHFFGSCLHFILWPDMYSCDWRGNLSCFLCSVSQWPPSKKCSSFTMSEAHWRSTSVYHLASSFSSLSSDPYVISILTPI